MSKTTQDKGARHVAVDMELERGLFTEGRYYVMTPRFDYLEAVTATSYVLKDVWVVFETGPYPDLLAGRPKDAQFLAKRAVLDRAGTHLFELPET